MVAGGGALILHPAKHHMFAAFKPCPGGPLPAMPEDVMLLCEIRDSLIRLTYGVGTAF